MGDLNSPARTGRRSSLGATCIVCGGALLEDRPAASDEATAQSGMASRNSNSSGPGDRKKNMFMGTPHTQRTDATVLRQRTHALRGVIKSAGSRTAGVRGPPPGERAGRRPMAPHRLPGIPDAGIRDTEEARLENAFGSGSRLPAIGQRPAHSDAHTPRAHSHSRHHAGWHPSAPYPDLPMPPMHSRVQQPPPAATAAGTPAARRCHGAGIQVGPVSASRAQCTSIRGSAVDPDQSGA